MDDIILKRAKEEIEQDKLQKQVKIAKTIKDKEFRDHQLREAQNHKQVIFRQQREQEIKEVNELQVALT